MAARLWGLLLGCNLVIATAASALSAIAIARNRGVPLLIGMAVFICIPVLILAVSFIFPIRARNGSAVRSGLTLRALIIEWVQFSRAILSILVAPWGTLGIERNGAARPVLLVHGLACNRGVWRPWFQKLRTAGFAPVRAIDLEPLFTDIDSQAAEVVRELRDMQRECDGARIAILCHSMGGLIARAALRHAGPELISQIVTIASPHRGSAVACLFPWAATRQMCPGSTWLQALEASESVPLAVPVTSIYSLQDNLIVPARSAAMNGAHLQELRGLGHMGMLFSHRSIASAITALQRG